MKRRSFLEFTAAGALLAACGRSGSRGEGPTPGPAGSGATGWPEKAKDLILLTDRPPNLEMPVHYLEHDLTPNDAFFVRWHLANVPTSVDLETFRLRVSGEVEHELAWSIDELRKFDPVTVVAVNQCSGNSRALAAPRVPGVQWTVGAVGNARWTGVRLADLLARAKLKSSAKEVTFRGLDTPALVSVPAFVKALDVSRAVDADILVAYAMNDAPLPMLNGFPLRLVVPGWYSTYWVKALTEISVVADAFQGFWMAKAYRVPKTEGADESPVALAKETVPISRMNVRSLVVRPTAGDAIVAGSTYELQGIAFDGGSGIRGVEVSTDGGMSWRDARLDADLGKFSFRRWRASWTPTVVGDASVTVRATSVAGETQRATPQWNRSGYMRNVVERVNVRIT